MATRSLVTDITAQLFARYTLTPSAAEGGKSPSEDIRKTFKLHLGNGTGANQADRIWGRDGITIGASVTDEIHLADLDTVTPGAGGDISNNIGYGAQNDIFGQTWSIVNLRFLWIANVGTTSLRLEAGTNALALFGAAGDQVLLPSNGLHLFGGGEDAGIVIAADTSDELKIENLDASAGKYDFWMIGTSA